MNSVEYVRDELLKRGYPWMSANVKALPAIIDIVANTDHNWQDYGDAVEELERRKRHLYCEVLERFRDDEKKIKRLISDASSRITAAKEIEARTKEREDAIQSWIDLLNEFETAEARDRVRLFRLFVRAERPRDKTHDRYNDVLQYLLTGSETGLEELKQRYNDESR